MRLCGEYREGTSRLAPVKTWRLRAMGSRSWCTRREWRAIADVTAFFEFQPTQDIKTVAYMAEIA